MTLGPKGGGALIGGGALNVEFTVDTSKLSDFDLNCNTELSCFITTMVGHPEIWQTHQMALLIKPIDPLEVNWFYEQGHPRSRSNFGHPTTMVYGGGGLGGFVTLGGNGPPPQII